MDRLREISSEVGISTDLIVGFPTETEEDFQETIKLLDRVQYDNIYAFAYSPRPGTRAAKLEDDVPDEVKNDRLNRLLQHEMKIAERRYADRVGKTMEILVEGDAKKQKMANGGEGRVWTGRTTCNRVVNFVSDANRNLLGRFLEVEIVGATALALQGELIVDPTRAEDLTGEAQYAPPRETEVVPSGDGMAERL
jgi:tRNA-2-methylthio-N6-dimethylallyladenosine synthase